jgi:hypothetical protein
MIAQGLVGLTCGHAGVREKEIKCQRQQTPPGCYWFVVGAPGPCALLQYCAGRSYGGRNQRGASRYFSI